MLVRLVQVADGLYVSGLAAAQDAAAVRAAGITHVVNLTRSARNCAEQSETSTGAAAGELHCLRLPVLGNKGEPYRDLWQRLAAHASSVHADAGKLLVHGATDAIELRVFVMCAGVLAGAAWGMSLTHALARVTDAQREALAGREGPVGLAMWHLKPLYEWVQTVDEGRLAGETLDSIKAKFEHPNTPQAQLACCDWRCGPTDAVLRIGGEDAEEDAGDYPLLYGRARTTVWFGGHRMVVESVGCDPRVAFIHNLVTAEEAQELIAAAQNVGLKQSLVGNMKERYMHAVPPSAEEVREEAARQGRTSTSCRVDRSLPVSAAVVLRVSFLLGMSPYCSEAVQVVHYEEGQEYQVHNDWFHPEDPFYQDRVRLRGQRLVSVFCYLCDVPEGCGGGTFFPALNLRFLPRTGCAALWWNQTHDTKIMDERVGHCGEKPTKGKQKWGLNVWLRERASKEGAVYRRDPIGRVVTEDGLVRFFPPRKIPA